MIYILPIFTWRLDQTFKYIIDWYKVEYIWNWPQSETVPGNRLHCCGADNNSPKGGSRGFHSPCVRGTSVCGVSETRQGNQTPLHPAPVCLEHVGDCGCRYYIHVAGVLPGHLGLCQGHGSWRSPARSRGEFSVHTRDIDAWRWEDAFHIVETLLRHRVQVYIIVMIQARRIK